MKEKHMQKDATRSETENILVGIRNDNSPAISDAEVELALQRLQLSVSGEPVPGAWSSLEEHSKEHIEIKKANEPVFQLQDENEVTLPVERVGHIGHVKLSKSGLPELHYRRTAGRRLWQRLISGLVACGALVALFISPIGAKVMAAAMQTMYFQNLFGVGQDDLTEIENALSSDSTDGTNHIDLKKYGSVEESGNRNFTQNMNYADAAKQANLPVKKLPGFEDTHDSVSFHPPQDITFRFHVDAINELITHLGGTTKFPEAVNGQPIVFHIPAQMSENVNGSDGKAMNLNEMKVPVVQVPNGVDLDEVRQALIDLPFLPEDMKHFLSTSQNWKNTILIPTNGKTTNMTIDGNPAVLQAFGQDYNSIIWLEDGVLYQLSGSQKAFPTASSLITEAEELAK